MRAERRAIVGWIAFCALFACSFTSRAFAGVVRMVVVDEVSISVDTPWPTMLNHGAQPVWLEFENPHDDARRVDVKFSNYGTFVDTVTTRVDLAAKQHARVELFLPVLTDGASAFNLELRVRGDRGFVSGVGCSEQPENGVRNVLVVSMDPPDAAALATWGTSLHEEALPRFTEPTDTIKVPSVSLSVGSFGSMVTRRPSAGLPTSVVHVNAVSTRALPTRSEAYSSIDGLVFDTSSPLPNEAALGGIAAWVRLGNVLAFYGRDAQRVVGATAEFAPWIDPRFLVRAVDGVSVYACGQGLVVVGESAQPFEATAQVHWLNWAMETCNSWIPRFGKDRGDESVLALPGLELPYRPLTLLLVLFAILIGPVNFFVVRKMKKPALLLLTVPSIALLFSLGLFAYGAFSQGLDVRAVSETFTLLDQRTHRSTSSEVRQIFAGLSTGDGLVPGPGASAWRDIGDGSWRDQLQCTIDFGAQVVLGGSFMPVRTPTRQTLLTDRASRLRIDVRPDGDGWIVENALGVAIRSIELCDFDGQRFATTNVIAAGSRSRIAKVADPSQPVAGTPTFATTLIFATTFEDGTSALPRGSYSAMIERSPFSDGFGIEARQVEPSFHHLVGILDANSAESKR